MEIKFTNTPASELRNSEDQTIAEAVYKRKMASIRRLDEINPIPGADAIEAATIGGWRVVVKKGDFKAGDLAVYCEIDSWIPNSVAPFLTKPGRFPKVYNGVEGEKLRTIRLRRQISQGLLLPISVLGEIKKIDEKVFARINKKDNAVAETQNANLQNT